MRIVFPLLAAVLLATPAAVQAATTKPTPAHLSMQQRFEQANVTHDGHLTLDQAKAGYKSIVRHFTAIDHDNKGYITEDDIRAYYKTLRASHHQPAPTPSSAPTPAHSG
jgi:threonine aldolase